MQILNILENFDLAAHRSDGAWRQHLIAEAMKLAFADRAHWMGDPDFADVPRGLIDKAYAKQLASRIRQDSLAKVERHGIPPGADSNFFERHTTHFCTADGKGNWVACTATINTTFGSGVVIPGTGVFMNNEMDDFSVQPGVPNAFGLIGSEANSVAAGKRPLSSMSPTIALKDGKPIIALGAAGGPTIITQTVQNLIAMLDLGQSPESAIRQPRLHHQWRPDQVRVEKAMDIGVRSSLERLGHQLSVTGTMGVSHIIATDRDGAFVGAADPRGIGTVAGY